MDHTDAVLTFSHPFLFTFGLYAVIAAFIFLSLRPVHADHVLSRLQTEQIKGFAIIIIMISHLYGHLLEPISNFYIPDLGTIGVAIFLMASGYGICISLRKGNTQNFLFKRTVRIYTPIVVAMLFKIMLDRIFKNPEISPIIHVFKIFSNLPSLHPDLWYILFIFFWYSTVYILISLKLQERSKLLFMMSLSLLILTIPGLSPSWKASAFSFPLGYWIGLNSNTVQEKWTDFLKKSPSILILTVMGLLLFAEGLRQFEPRLQQPGILATALAIGIPVSIGSLWLFLRRQLIRHLVVEFIAIALVGLATLPYFKWVLNDSLTAKGHIGGWLFIDVSRLLFAIALMLAISLAVKFKVYSAFLQGAGKLSYELYILHGIFLIPFDFVLFRGPLAMTLPVYCAVLVLMSLGLNHLSAGISKIVLGYALASRSSQEQSPN